MIVYGEGALVETFELILLLLTAVLISAVLEKIIPKVSLPLIQIGIGLVFGLLAVSPIEINLDPEFFLLVFIAPLLFHDAKESDKLALWKNRKLILLLAVGLVVIIMLAVGFTMHLLEPSIPLAVAFALGAALGPTDAVAVAALSGVADVPRKERALLSGESLINDASGVVAFQFAIAAATTGSFLVLESTIDFFIEFFGGIALGLAIGWAANWVQRKVDRMGLDSTAFHVMFDVSLPFITYLLSEVVGVSGILAVVAAGIMLSALQNRTIGPSAAQLNIVSNSTWSVLSFALNGVVFTMLGMQLPLATQTTWDDVTLNNGQLVLYIGVITLILVVVRFVWVLAMDYFLKDPDTHKRREKRAGRIRSALITTIGGPKGAVTLSVIMSTPFLVYSGRAFPQRDLIIFLASGTILCTLLLANFLLPLLAPREETNENEEEIEAHRIDIFRTVIERLSDARTKENSRAISMVIGSYNERIERAQSRFDLETVSTVDLRLEVVRHQINFLMDEMDAGRIDEYEGFRYMRRLQHAKDALKRDRDRRLNTRQIRRAFGRVRNYLAGLRQHLSRDEELPDQMEIQIATVEEAIRYLHEMLQSDDDRYPTEVITRVLLNHQATLRAIHDARPSITSYAKTTDRIDRTQRLAYNIELEEIQEALDRGEISRTLAKEMRENVYLMMVDLEVLGD